MRVALLNPRPQRRGAELFSRELAGELRRRRHEVLEIYLYTPPPGDGLPPSPAELHLAEGPSRCERYLGWDPSLARRLREALLGFGAEVIQASGGATVKYAALTAGRLPTPPLVVYRSIGEPDRWIRGWRRKWFYRSIVFPRVTAVVSISRSYLARLEAICTRALVTRHIPRSLDVGALTPSATREQIRVALTTPADAPVTLFAGKLSQEKRVDRLLRAFARAGERLADATLWIAGDGSLANELRDLAGELGVAYRVRFLGARDDVGNLLAACDLVALTSDTEGVPTILREAAYLGKAVVATRVGRTEETVADGETGVLVDPDDEQALARALAELLADSERRRRMGAAAAARSSSSALTIEAIGERYLELYSQGLSRMTQEAGA